MKRVSFILALSEGFSLVRTEFKAYLTKMYLLSSRSEVMFFHSSVEYNPHVWKVDDK